MTPYKVGDAVCIIPFDELVDMCVEGDDLYEFMEEDGVYGITGDSIDMYAGRGIMYIREVNEHESGRHDYKLKDADGSPLAFWWLHYMLRPADEFEDEDIVSPESADGLFDFLLN